MNVKSGILAVFALAIVTLIFLYWAHLPVSSHESYIKGHCSTVSHKNGLLRVVSFNIAFGQGISLEGRLSKDRPETESNLYKIAGVLRNVDADIVLLQEVDLASKRTYFIDEAAFIASYAGFSCYACVTTWVKNYVPYPYWPPWRQFGRMKSGQCILSKYPILSSERIALPQRSDKPFFYTAFYLNRAIQAADISVNGEIYKVFNVHLEAFDEKNRDEQARILEKLLAKSTAKKIIVGGDFNSQNFTLADASFKEVVKAPTFPAVNPFEQLDYIFFKGFIGKGANTLNTNDISDHLPVYVELTEIRRR